MSNFVFIIQSINHIKHHRCTVKYYTVVSSPTDSICFTSDSGESPEQQLLQQCLQKLLLLSGKLPPEAPLYENYYLLQRWVCNHPGSCSVHGVWQMSAGEKRINLCPQITNLCSGITNTFPSSYSCVPLTWPPCKCQTCLIRMRFLLDVLRNLGALTPSQKDDKEILQHASCVWIPKPHLDSEVLDQLRK